MNDWFRSWHGAPTDPRWLAVARRAGINPGEVSAIVWALLDHASQNGGSIRRFDREGYADFSQIGKDRINSVISALENKGVIIDHKFTRWHGKTWWEPVNLRPPLEEWKELRELVFKRDAYTCTYCGASGGTLECDHIIPVSRGGSNEPDNLTTACQSCNRSKGALTGEEFLQMRRGAA